MSWPVSIRCAVSLEATLFTVNEADHGVASMWSEKSAKDARERVEC